MTEAKTTDAIEISYHKKKKKIDTVILPNKKNLKVNNGT